MPYRRTMTHMTRWLTLLVVGDWVTVLYDEKDPGRSCFLVR